MARDETQEPFVDLGDAGLQRTRLTGEAVPPKSSARRRWKALSLALCLGVLLVVSFAWARSSLPARTTTGSGNVLLVTSNVSFGQLSLNGKPLQGKLPMMVHLSQGVNDFMLTAPPFFPRVCNTRWQQGEHVQAGGDPEHCQVSWQTPPAMLNGKIATIGELTIFLGPNDLPINLQEQAEQLMQGYLTANSASFSVPVGDYIAMGRDASGSIISTRTTQPVHAVLQLTLSTLAYAIGCLPGCGGDSFSRDTPPPPTGKQWLTTAPIERRWAFLTDDNSELSYYVEDDLDTPYTISLILNLSASGAWSLADQSSPRDPNSVSGAASAGPFVEELSGYSCYNVLRTSSMAEDAAKMDANSIGISFRAPSPTQGAGCGFMAYDQATQTHLGEFVWRWGVLLAADAGAHKLLPSLPVAPQSEIDAVGGFAWAMPPMSG